MDPSYQSQIRTARMMSFAVCGVMFGLFLCFPGITLTAMGNVSSHWYYDTSHRVMRVIGPILLVSGLTLFIVGIAACVHLKKTLPQAAATGTVGQPVVSGMAPGGGTYPPVGVAMQQAQGNYPPQPGQVGFQQQPSYQSYVPQDGYPPQPSAPPVYGQNMGYPDSAVVPDVPPPSYEDMKK